MSNVACVEKVFSVSGKCGSVVVNHRLPVLTGDARVVEQASRIRDKAIEDQIKHIFMVTPERVAYWTGERIADDQRKTLDRVTDAWEWIRASRSDFSNALIVLAAEHEAAKERELARAGKIGIRVGRRAR